MALPTPVHLDVFNVAKDEGAVVGDGYDLVSTLNQVSGRTAQYLACLTTLSAHNQSQMYTPAQPLHHLPVRVPNKLP